MRRKSDALFPARHCYDSAGFYQHRGYALRTPAHARQTPQSSCVRCEETAAPRSRRPRSRNINDGEIDAGEPGGSEPPRRLSGGHCGAKCARQCRAKCGRAPRERLHECRERCGRRCAKGGARRDERTRRRSAKPEQAERSEVASAARSAREDGGAAATPSVENETDRAAAGATTRPADGAGQAARQTGMPRVRALSTRLSVMPLPGKAITPFGRRFSSSSLRRNGAARP